VAPAARQYPNDAQLAELGVVPDPLNIGFDIFQQGVNAHWRVDSGDNVRAQSSAVVFLLGQSGGKSE